ncbi:hypothetical protein ACEUCD_11380 [Aeromonas veronii]
MTHLTRLIVFFLILGVFLRFEYFFDANRYITLRLYFLLLIIYCFFSANKGSVCLGLYTTIILTLITSLLFSFFWLDYFSDPIKDIFRTIFHFSFFMVPYLLAICIRRNAVVFDKSSVRWSIISSLCISTVEAIVRIFFPLSIIETKDSWDNSAIESGISSGLSASNFYVFKYGSFMFTDSNGLAIILVSLLGLTLLMRYRLLSLWTITLILLCFSRSAYLGAVFTCLLYYLFFVNKSMVAKHINIMLVGMLSFFSIYWLIYSFNILEDGSLITKFEIFSHLNKVFDYPIESVLFGFGIDKGNYIYSPGSDYYAHALIPLLLGHVGIIGVVIYLLVMFYSAFIYGFRIGMIFFIPFLIMGLSLASPWEPAPFVFMLISGLYFESVKKYKND